MIAAAMMTWKDHDDFETINAIVQPLLEEFGPGGLAEHCRELLASTATLKRVRDFAESIVKVTEFYSALAGGHRVGQPAAE